MKILHVSQYCHVESIGGTERFIVDLIHELDELGHTSAIGWLTINTEQQTVHDGIWILPLPGTPMRVDMPSPRLSLALDDATDKFNPDVIHFHTFGRSEAAIADWAKLRGIPYVFTYHSPGWTCRREDLMAFNGTSPCDGEVRTFRCSACKLHDRLSRVPAWLAWLTALGSIPFSLLLARCAQTSLRRRTAFIADTWVFRRTLRKFLGKCDLVFACAEWSIPVLFRNGACQNVLRFCPQGVSREMTLPDNQVDKAFSANKPFTVGYVGRVVAVKGVDILLEGFRRIDGQGARLLIYGWPEHVPKDNFYQYIIRAAAEDSRIQLIPRLPMAEIGKAYDEIDLLCVPSVCLETGPLVLLEALQRGIPVYGSSRVGQLGLLKNRGLVVESNTSEQWHSVLKNAIREHSRGNWPAARLRALGFGAPRTMADVAREISEGYSVTCKI